MGNYLYCHDCVLKAIHVSRQRLARQRRIKRNKFQQEVTMTKKEIDEKKLGPFVVMPSTIELCFKIWWQDLPDEHEVSVRYPFERHGLAGRISNHAKTDTKRKFLDFVDSNSQPNGRQLDSRNPTHYLSPKFTTITTPKEGVHNYESRLSTSLLGEFNRIQEEIGESTISNYSASTWLKTDRPKIAIHPHKVDYCDKCAMIKSKIQEKQTTINRKLQSGNALLEEIKAIEEEKQVLENELQTHRDVARDSLQYYKEAKEKCAQDWAKICELEMKSNKTHSEEDELSTSKHCFTLLLSADYQMQKLLPYWGRSPQPGMTYYLQKLSYDLLGIVDHRDDSAAVYIFDERVGHKTADHTFSYLLHYLKSTGKVPSWVSRVHVFLDNAGSTNKNQYLMSACLEVVQQRVLQFLRVSFMIPGHTKFAPDVFFAKIAKAFYAADVFSEEDLQQVVEQFALVIFDKGGIVRTWREKVGEKYSSLPGIRELHDFVTIAMPSNKVVMKVRPRCYTGPLQDTPTKIKRGFSAEESCIPRVTDTYKAKGLVKQIPESKLGHLIQMYNNFIEQERWPDFITPT